MADHHKVDDNKNGKNGDDEAEEVINEIESQQKDKDQEMTIEEQNQQSSIVKRDKCHKLCNFYQRQFRSVPILKSTDFLSEMANDENVILVDVRTAPEQKISMVQGAITLKEFHENIAPTLSPSSSSSSLPLENSDKKVITYCTIGYRSGMEARHLQNKYGLHGHVYNLDGIVSYTHALQECLDDKSNSNKQDKDSTLFIRQLVTNDPETGTMITTQQVHTFGSDWNLAHDNFETTYFPFCQFLLQMMRVVGLVILRTLQLMIYYLTFCCRR